MSKDNVLIIGASASIGTAVLSVFVKNDCNIIATYNKTPIKYENDKVKKLKLNIKEKKSRDNLFNIVNRIDVLIMLSGVLPGKSLEEYTENEIESLLSLNLTSQIITIKGILPKMNNGGRILFLSSISGEQGSFDSVYAATKGGIIPFAKSLASWYGSKLRVNIITPSLIENSTMYQEMSKDRIAFHKKKSPTGKLVKMESLAEILYDLSKPNWNVANGSVIRVNGGVYG